VAKQTNIFNFFNEEQFIINALKNRELSELELFLMYKRAFGRDICAFTRKILELEEKGVIERVKAWPINKLKLKGEVNVGC